MKTSELYTITTEQNTSPDGDSLYLALGAVVQDKQVELNLNELNDRGINFEFDQNDSGFIINLFDSTETKIDCFSVTEESLNNYIDSNEGLVLVGQHPVEFTV